MRVYGADLRVGDVMRVWWRPGLDTIIALRPYAGAYEGAEGWEGVQIATFALLPSRDCTMFPGDRNEVVNREVTP